METIGLTIEGAALKLVHIQRRKNRIKVLAVESVPLPEPISDSKLPVRNLDALETRESEDPFGLKNPSVKGHVSRVNSAAQTNSEVILGVLKKYPLKSARLYITLPEASADYTVFSNKDGLKGRTLLKRLSKECLSAGRANEPRYIKVDETMYLLPRCAGEINPENTPLLSYLREIKPLLNQRMTIAAVIPQEAALAAAYKYTEAALSVIIYIPSTRDYARILFLKRGILCGVSPVIICNGRGDDKVSVIYARFLFELDRSSYPVPDEILFCGEGSHNDIIDYFRNAYPDTVCSPLVDDTYCDMSLLDESQVRDLPAYTVPLGAATAGLRENERVYSTVNFLPETVREEQNSFRLAWHGYAALTLLFAASLFFTIERITLSIQKKQAEFQSSLVSDAITAEKAIQKEIVEIERQAAYYHSVVVLIDSIRSTTPSQSALLKTAADETKRLNSIWMTHISTAKNTYRISGEAVYRSRIHQLAGAVQNSVIQRMSEENIRESTVYTFDITGSMEQWRFPRFNGNPSDSTVSAPVLQSAALQRRK